MIRKFLGPQHFFWCQGNFDLVPGKGMGRVRMVRPPTHHFFFRGSGSCHTAHGGESPNGRTNLSTNLHIAKGRSPAPPGCVQGAADAWGWAARACSNTRRAISESSGWHGPHRPQPFLKSRLPLRTDPWEGGGTLSQKKSQSRFKTSDPFPLWGGGSALATRPKTAKGQKVLAKTPKSYTTPVALVGRFHETPLPLGGGGWSDTMVWCDPCCFSFCANSGKR